VIPLGYAIALAAACVIISGFCSGTEVALFSLRRVDREQLARGEAPADRRIARMLERPRRLIATVLVGNEAFNALLAVVMLAAVIGEVGDRVSPWGVAGIALAIALPLVVLVGEVTAKTLAAKAPLAWARACALPLEVFGVIVTPVRVVVAGLAALLLKPFGESVRAKPHKDLSEQEFRSLVDAGSAQGQVDARERRLIHRVFEFSDKNVGQVMTPRERIFALSYELPAQRLAKEVAARGFSRVPIYQKSLDNVRGFVNAKDLVRAAVGQMPARPLADVLHEPLFVPRTTPVKRLFLTFKQKKVHMAVVVSEYGKVLGLVTMDDLLAQIFGVLRDERTDLQMSNPNLRVPRTRTPGYGVVTGERSGPVPRVDLDTGPTGATAQPEPRETPPATRETPPATRETPPATRETPRPGSEPSGADTPVEPMHEFDEVTPPATEIDELAARREERSRK
jgi:CBS domain containing-hemolysin-like protein